MDLSKSLERYEYRISKWCFIIKFLPRFRHHIWWLLHNCISHPLIGIFPIKPFIYFHDKTSQHLNLFRNFKNSNHPKIDNYFAWIKHNVIAHMMIGLFPCEKSFSFHDKTSEEMNVPDWV